MYRKQELTICNDIEMLNKMLNALSENEIKYEYKLFSHNNQGGSIGSRRGMFGSAFDKCDTQYTVYVSKKDYIAAERLLKQLRL